MLHENKQSNQDGIRANFKYKLLSALQNNSQRGTTLVVGVALGALMIGATGLAIATSSQNKTNVTSDEQSAQALAAAEAGVARIQNLLAKEPRLATEDWFEGDDENRVLRETDEIMADLGLATGGSCVNFEDAASGEGLDEAELEEIIGKLSTDDPWSDVGTDTAYRLVNFKGADKNSLPGTATLAIQGRRNNSNSIAQIEVQIPVTENNNEESFPGTTFGPPGLWAQNFGQNPNSEGVRINANVVDSSQCNPSADKTWDDYIAGFNKDPQDAFKANFQATKSNLKFPSLPNNGKYTVPSVRSDKSNPISSCPSKGTILPRVGDTPVSGDVTSGTYVYNFNLDKCDIILGKSGKETIEIYSNESINTRNTDVTAGSTVIVHGNKGLEMNGNAKVNKENPQNFQFYIYSGNVDVGGTTETVGFIFAPNSVAQYGGNSSHFGAIWAKTFQGNGGGGNGGLTATLTADALDDLLIDVTTFQPPTIGSITSFTRQPISQE